MCTTLTRQGQRRVHPGTDGQMNQFEDQQLPNFRMLENWELLVSDCRTLAANFGVGGIYLHDAQSMPLIMAPDLLELLRRDSDGEMHYDPVEVLLSPVVIANAEFGFWRDRSPSWLDRFRANPLLVKLARTMWATHPDFLLVGECHWGREATLLCSGMLPHSLALADALARVADRQVDKMGVVKEFHRPTGV